MIGLAFGVIEQVVKKGKKAVPLSHIAIWNEYGTETAPPRPAFREGFDYAIKANEKLIEAQMKNITKRIIEGREADLEKSLISMLTQIGRMAKAKTKEIIEQGTTEPNAPSTIARKGFDHPLYEKGTLLKNVDYEVFKE